MAIQFLQFFWQEKAKVGLKTEESNWLFQDDAEPLFVCVCVDEM